MMESRYIEQTEENQRGASVLYIDLVRKIMKYAEDDLKVTVKDYGKRSANHIPVYN